MVYSVRLPGSVTMPKYRYEEVADDLRARIAAGEFPPGSKLPSRSELCQHYQVSQIVADRAMWLLRQEGLTESLPGVGVYVKEPE
jgi:DNA-binding GntR family transcriptional regulator